MPIVLELFFLQTAVFPATECTGLVSQGLTRDSRNTCAHDVADRVVWSMSSNGEQNLGENRHVVPRN